MHRHASKLHRPHAGLIMIMISTGKQESVSLLCITLGGSLLFVPKVIAPATDGPVAAASASEPTGSHAAAGGDGDPPKRDGDDRDKKHVGQPPVFNKEGDDDDEEDDESDTDKGLMPYEYYGKRMLGSSCQYK